MNDRFSPVCWTVLVLLLLGRPAEGGEIPFAERQPIDTRNGISNADLDGDSDLDILGTCGNGGLCWFENIAGDGSAWSERAITNDVWGYFAEAGDFDGDGDLDVFAGFIFAPTLCWWENAAGDGSTWKRHFLDQTGSPAAIGDLDGDGDLDLIGYDSDLKWWENSAGDGSIWIRHGIQLSTVGPQVTAVDFDQDGDLDLVGESDDALRWWENDAGNGFSWIRRNIATGLSNVRFPSVVDLDKDGDLDLLAGVREVTESRVSWWENSAGTWTEHRLLSIAAGYSPKPRPVDLDGDGDLDFVLAMLVTSSGPDVHPFSWWENTAGDASVWTEHVLDPDLALYRILAEDLDQDGDIDLLTTVEGGLNWWENITPHRNAAFTREHLIANTLTDAVATALADVDGDGDPDILAGTVGGTITWWSNHGGDLDVDKFIIDTDFLNPRQIGTSDLDGDGDLDALAVSSDLDAIHWWENAAGDGTAWAEHVVSDAFPGGVATMAVDLDSDGDLDVVGGSTTAGVLWWENTERDGSSWSVSTIDDGVEARSVEVVDLDADGDLDVSAPDRLGNQILWWENTLGDGSAWIRHDVATDLDGVHGVVAHDLNRDGQLDLVASAQFDEKIAWWANDGTGISWTERPVSSSAASVLAVADLNGDAAPDIFGFHSETNELLWWRNFELDSDWSATQVTGNLFGGTSVMAADFDDDGDRDLITTAGNAITWWENLGGQAELITIDAVRDVSVFTGSNKVPLLEIRARHHGRFGDDDLEIARLEILFEEAPGDPLSDAEANALMETLRLYRDDGDEVFDPAVDTAVYAVGAPWALNAGMLTLDLADNASQVGVTVGDGDLFGEAVFFVAIDFAESSGSMTLDSLLLTHLVALAHPARSVVEMRSTDFKLTLADPRDGSSTVINIIAAVFADGFETGDFSAWSAIAKDL